MPAGLCPRLTGDPADPPPSIIITVVSSVVAKSYKRAALTVARV